MGCFWNAQQAEIEMIYSQEVADINFAETFVPIHQVGLSFECSNPFKSFPTLKGNKYVQIELVACVTFFFFFLAGWWLIFLFQPRKDSGAERTTVHVLLFRPLLDSCCCFIEEGVQPWKPGWKSVFFCLYQWHSLHRLPRTDADLGGFFSGFLRGLLGDYLIKPIVYKR